MSSSSSYYHSVYDQDNETVTQS